MSHKIPSLVVEDDLDLYDTVAAYIQAVLCVYIRRFVGDEPREPIDWSLPRQGCECSHCAHVYAFMADGSGKYLKYADVERGRKHLDLQYYCRDPQYDISVDRSNRPFNWVCMKDHKAPSRETILCGKSI